MKDRLFCCIWDIKDLKDNNVLVDLEISNTETIIENYMITLDLNKMGLKQDDEFANELHRDIENFINNFYDDYKKIPTIEQIKEKVEVNWLETKVWLEMGDE